MGAPRRGDKQFRVLRTWDIRPPVESNKLTIQQTNREHERLTNTKEKHLEDMPLNLVTIYQIMKNSLPNCSE